MMMTCSPTAGDLLVRAWFESALACLDGRPEMFVALSFERFGGELMTAEAARWYLRRETRLTRRWLRRWGHVPGESRTFHRRLLAEQKAHARRAG